MALIKCSECGRDISDRATACPNCGHPHNAPNSVVVQIDAAAGKRRKYRIGILIFTPLFIIGAFLLLLSFFQGGSIKAVLGLFLGLLGFVGVVFCSIGEWLNNP